MRLLTLIVLISLVFSQSNDLNKLRRLAGGIVSGKVKDEIGNPLIGANIFIKGTKFGGASNKVEKTYRCKALKYFSVDVENNF